MAANFVPVVRQFICRDQELAEVDTSIRAPVINSRVYQSL